MTSNQQRAVEVLNRHWSVAQETQQDDEAVCCAQALADAGLLMPDSSRLNREWAWTGLDQGHIYIRYAVDDTHLSPMEARELALDLLAAAHHMEKNA